MAKVPKVPHSRLYQEWQKPNRLEQLRKWAKDGLTNADIAANIGIVASTLSKWLDKYPCVAEAIAEGQDTTDDKVENALLKRALGFEYEESKTVVEVLETGERRQRVEKVQRLYPGDVTAQIFWLKNRRPRDWRDRKDVELAGSVGLVQIVDDIPRVGEDNAE